MKFLGKEDRRFVRVVVKLLFVGQRYRSDRKAHALDPLPWFLGPSSSSGIDQ